MRTIEHIISNLTVISGVAAHHIGYLTVAFWLCKLTGRILCVVVFNVLVRRMLYLDHVYQVFISTFRLNSGTDRSLLKDVLPVHRFAAADRRSRRGGGSTPSRGLFIK